MTPRRGPARESDHGASDYLANGEQMIAAARELLILHDGNARAKSVALSAVHAAIAFADALTVAKLNRVNSGDHASLPALVAQAAGQASDAANITRLRRIIRQKNQADYGGNSWEREDAERLVVDTERFAAWVRTLL